MIINNIKNMIITAMNHECLIHFSHTDLDGFGCHLVTRKVCLREGVSMPITYNSDDLGDKFQDFLEKAIRLIMSNNGRMTFLVTDIGEIDFIELTKKLANYRINLIIVDHHAISNPEKVGNNYTHDDETGLDIYTYENEYNDSYVYVHSTKNSATWLLAQILGVTNHDEFYWISEYDCGRWGEWRLDKEHTPTNMVRMNQALQIIKSAYSDEKDSVILHHLETYAEYLTSNICDPETEAFGKLLDFNVRAKCNENTRSYYKWVKKLNIVPISHYSYIFKVGLNTDYEKRVEVKFPEDPVYMGTWAVIIQEDKDEGPFSTYAKQYLEDHLIIKGIIKYTPNFKDIVSFRSASDEVDVSKIAVLNGGGGHPRAAGFMAKPEILM